MKQTIRKEYNVLISVDESILRSEREPFDERFSIKEAIRQEFGWLYKSGIYLDKIEKFHKKRN